LVWLSHRFGGRDRVLTWGTDHALWSSSGS